MISYAIISIFFFIFFHLLFIKVNLVDIPNNRKIHKNNVPFSGGISLLLSMALITFFEPINIDFYLIILISVFFLIGFMDDILNINPKIRLITLTLTSLFLVIKGYLIKDLGFVNLDTSNMLVLILAISFSIFCILVTINAFNFIDGLDGLLGTLVIAYIFSLLIFSDLKVIDNQIFKYLLIAMFIFLFFNLTNTKYKIFLGDGGSYLIGSIIALSMIYYTNIEKLIEPSLIIWSCPIVYFDFLYIFIFRKFSNFSLIYPDNNHLHHILLTKFNKLQVLVMINILNIILILIGFMYFKYINQYSTFVYIFLFCIYLFIRYKFIKSKKNNNK